MRFMQRSLMGLFLLALTVGLLALAGGSLRAALEARMNREVHPRPSRERVFSVDVLRAEAVTAVPRIVTFGEIRSRRSLDLRLPVGGTITELHPAFVEGGRVAAGELLLKLDPSDMQSALDLAATEKNDAEAEEADARRALALARDDLAGAEAQAGLRRAALERQQDLLRRGVGTEAAVETAALADAAARQAVLGKRQALAQAEARLARAAVARERARIRLADAKRRLADTELRAAFSGVLSSVAALPGGRIGPNERVGRLIDPARLEVSFRLSNLQFARLGRGAGPVGRKLSVRLDILGAAMVSGAVIERIGAEVGEGQTGRQVFARLTDGAEAGFHPGDFVSVDLPEPAIENAVVLPATAVDSAGRLLVLGEGERLEERQAEVLRRQGDTVIVAAPGIAGLEVVAARTPLLGAGIRIKPLRRGGEQAAGAPETPEMIALSPERRAKLMQFVEGSANIPDAAKERIIGRLKQERVPAAMVDRIESRMGG